VGWHAVWLGMLAIVGAVLATGGFTASERFAGLSAIGALVLLYLVVGARLVGGSRDLPAALYLVGVVAAMLVVQSVAGLDLLAPVLFALFPQLWTLLSRTGAVLATIAVPLVLGAARSAQLGWEPAAVRGELVQAVAQVAVALLLGLWITGLVRESTGRAELIAELDAARGELASAEHARGVLAERERMAREIHDTLAQGFASVVVLAQAADAALDGVPGDGADLARQRLALMGTTARANLAEARAIVEAMRPAELEHDGEPGGGRLAAALVRVTRRFAAETGVATTVVGAERLPVLAPETEVVLLRAAQEGLSNVRQHYGASSATLRVTVDDGEVVLEVVDDGLGPGPQSVGPDASPGYGLTAMASRLREVGGRAQLAPGAAGVGSVLSVQVPMAREPS